jgi:16S rRNA (uracil1498-N3)-methyltransferase
VNISRRDTAAHVFVSDVEQPVLNDEDERHLRKSLRLRDGELISVSDGVGKWSVCAFRSPSLLEVVSDVHEELAPPQLLTVAIAPVKSDRTDFAVEKMTEVGIDHIIVMAPLRRSVVRWDQAKGAHHIERLRRIAKNAAMQSRRVFLPHISGPTLFTDVLAMPEVVVADPDGQADLHSCQTVVVGPEGGFDPDEYDESQRRVSLGSTVLRAETAAIVAATLMVAHRNRHTDNTGY